MHRRAQILDITTSKLLRPRSRPDTQEHLPDRSPNLLMANVPEMLTAAAQFYFVYQQACFAAEIDVPYPAVSCKRGVSAVEAQVDASDARQVACGQRAACQEVWIVVLVVCCGSEWFPG